MKKGGLRQGINTEIAQAQPGTVWRQTLLSYRGAKAGKCLPAREITAKKSLLHGTAFCSFNKIVNHNKVHRTRQSWSALSHS